MLIIFDLDDTLIDTSGAITPFKLNLCLNSLVSQGVLLGCSYERALKQLLSINERSVKSKSAVEEFAFLRGANQKQVDIALAEMSTDLPSDFKVPLTPNVLDTLQYLKGFCELAIVTGGVSSFQNDKLKKAGIDTSCFSMIAISEDSIKRPFYQSLQARFSLPSDQIWVCGDRVEVDLLPGFEMGFKTVHMKWGRGSLLQGCHYSYPTWIDYSINDLSKLKEIIR